MFSKFSVKKPYTVIVGVVMVLLLGVISFMNSTTDLLPEMELPYVVVYTTYPGASAEKVETSLTRVLESAVGTTENLVNMTSISSDNLSMIILEFADDTNMDSAMINLNAQIDLVEGMLDETVSTPTLMAINPNMLPIMMATVDADGQDLQELSDFVQDDIVPELEKVNGVASITTTGLLEETVQIMLNQDKIEEINNKILASVNSELAKTERELRDSLNEVNDGLDKIADGESELANTKGETIDKLAQSSVQLQQAATNLIAMDSQVTQLKAEKAAFSSVVDGYTQLNDSIVAAQTLQGQLGGLIASYQTSTGVIGESDLGMIRAIIDGMEVTEPRFDSTSITTYEDFNGYLTNKKAVLDAMVLQLQDQSTAMQQTVEDAKVKLNNLEIEIATAEGVKQAATAMLSQAGFDTSNLANLQAQLEAGKITAGSEFTKGELTISSTKESLEAAKVQLEDGLKQLEEAKKEALKSADITSLLNSSMISNILMAENFSMPAGYIASDDASILLKVGNEFASLDEVENLLITNIDIDGVGKIYLKDLATIQVVNNSEDIYTKVNGNDGVMISFQKTSTSSTANVCKSINKRFDTLEEKYDGLHFTALMDQGVYIDTIISSVLNNFAMGGILAILVLFLFLKDIKPTIVIGLSIPISLMFSIVLMYFSGVTLNVISLSGLALGVGMLVDNSVVVVENIYRLRNEGVGLIKASIEGAKQVSGAIIASTLTTVCVFLPIVFATGLAKQLFVDMGLTIAYSLFASLIVALTLVPMLSSKLLKKPNKNAKGIFNSLVSVYEKTLKASLNHKSVILIAVVALLAFSGYLTTQMPMSLIPSMNSGQVSLSVTLLDEEVTDQDKYEIYDKVIDRIVVLDGIDTVGVTSGGSGMMSLMSGGSSSAATFYIITDEKADIKKLEKEMIESLADLPITSSISTSNMDLTALGGNGISIRLTGNNLDDLQKASSLVASQLENIDGIDEVSDGNEDPTEELRVVIDKNEAMDYGLTVAQIYQTLASGIKDETSSTTLNISNKDYPVVLIQDSSSLITTSTLENTKLTGTKNQESTDVELQEIAKVENGVGMSSIYRENSRRYMTVNATIKDGYNVSLVSRNLDSHLDKSVLPEGVELIYEGENETIMETMSTLVQMILLAIAFIYMIMVAQFQSLLSPFIVMFTIPLAFTGGLLALAITGTELSIVAMLGFLVLCGIVVNNGIVFIDYANQCRDQGMETREALILTGKTRLRPILMTALTTILAMVTMALGIGDGSEMMQGMAIVTIGGLAYSTILTLYVVPIMVEILNKKRKNSMIIEEDAENGN